MSIKQRKPNRGIVLLVVLGMLSLFSVLVVSYVVFSAQMSETSFANNQKRLTDLPPEPVFDNAIISLLVGSNDPRSATFGLSMMEDFLGTDGLGMRVGHRRAGTPPASAAPMPANGQGMLLRPLVAGRPQTTLFKFPTNRAPWDYDGAVPPGGPALTNLATVNPPLRDNLDDVFAGRIVTFVEGPLYGISFRVVRSFGRANTGNNEENALASCLVIDLSEVPGEEVSIDGQTEQLYVVAGLTPNRLLYDVGPDGEPGIRGVNDDGAGAVDDDAEMGAPGSDDIGYRFILNGQPFNGSGQNPAGVTGLTRAGTLIDTHGHIELQPNARLMGTQAAGGNGTTFEYPQPDEQWDAADIENWFLAWQPSDHRRSRAAFETSSAVYSGVGAAELNRQLGQHIIPSFHRPAVINYLMNAPIWINGDITDPNDPNYFERTFAQLSGDTSAPNRDHERLFALITRLRRATMRPLNFDHLYYLVNSTVQSDLNADGSPYDGSPGFDGSNPTPVLSDTIVVDRPALLDSPAGSFGRLKSQVQRLAVWLTNGPWDVDNDNDGIPDSVWADFNLPAVQAPDGRLIKPLIAPLVEDFDGKININAAGCYNQMLTQNFQSTNLNNYSDDAEYFDVLVSLGDFGQGGGVGPAEIDFSHLFDEGTSPLPGYLGPVFRTQTSSPITNVLSTRYGNLLNARYGGQIFNYVPPYPPASFTKFPAANLLPQPIGSPPVRGPFANPQPFVDQLARIPYQSRWEWHAAFAPMGQPIDIAGRSQIRKDRYGNQRFSKTDALSQFPWGNELVNTPYEPGIDGSRGDDKPFTPSELHDFLNGGELAGRLTQLLGDAANRNEALRRLLTTESRSVDSPEVIGNHSILHLIASKVSVAGNLQTHLDRMLAVELRKGSKLNLNRPLGNGVNDNADSNTDDTFETETQLVTMPVVPNTANNRRAREVAFPKIAGEYPNQATAFARYAATTLNQNDFDGIDTDGDGNLDQGTPIGGQLHKIASGNELLARHLYCLMFSLIADPSNAVLVENFPYPPNFINDNAIRNRYAARRIAQWAVNAVDYRDTDVTCTRLRYDPNPFDGFDLAAAATVVVWGMERPEIEITESVAFHDKRLKRNLDKEPDPMDPSKTVDGELQVDEDPDDTDMDEPDSDMDQFRIPEASAYVEIRSLRSPIVSNGEGQPSYPPELYVTAGGTPRLDLGRTVGNGNLESPLYRLAVGQPTGGNRGRSTRWNFDAERLGNDLVAGGNRAEELDYLTSPAIDWTDAAAVNTAVDNWKRAAKHAAEVRHSLSTTGEYVTIADDDFDPTNDGGSSNRIRLDRFVWFTKTLTPNAGLNVVSNAASGMQLGKIFYNKNDLDNPGDATDPDNVAPTLAPGQYAIIGPRQVTRFGQTSDSNDTNDYDYSPVQHRLEFISQTTGSIPPFRLNMFNFAGTRLTPRYAEDAAGYDVDSVVPILCQALYPHEVDAARTDWSDYVNNNAPDQIVDMGFNISAPESGTAYYTAPEYRITADVNYPLKDGYRDYDNSVGFHPDTPLDHVNGTPLESNRWFAVGTHQEARTVFLQRLADPTVPWHPIDNPYLTLDFMPIDLSTFNGEHDVRQRIDRNGDGNANEHVDARPNPGGGPPIAVTRYDAANPGDFDPRLKFDSRRKIPDLTRDRAISVLLARVPTPGTNLADYERVTVAKRSAMSATASVLRSPGETGGTSAYWTFSLQSMWDNGTVTPAASALDTTYSVNRTFDTVGDPFRQTLGFVNREYGQPVRSSSPRARSLGTGTPDEVYLSAVPWANRDFQSSMDLMNVPAVSRTGLLATFSPGTRLEDNALREVPRHYDHLLGFNVGYAEYRNQDESSFSGPETRLNDPDDITGDRAGFEQIFDYVDTGPVWFDAQHWFEPNQVSYRQDDPMNPLGLRDRMFNRVVETLQPPFNFIGKHRTPGRVNLNTTPDYIRRGGRYYSGGSAFASEPAPVRQSGLLDIGERPEDPTNPGLGRVAYNPNNNSNNGNGFSTEFFNFDLYGNGSVHRALTWGISTAYELDDTPGSPVVMGEFNAYDQNVDTRFGRSFKAFIESRRGYASTNRGTAFFGNQMLDARYPTQFAGIFGPASAAKVPSVQRFMRTESAKGVAVRRRTHDMTLMRPHPDFDLRTMSDTVRSNYVNHVPNANSSEPFTIKVEEDPTGASVTLPPLNPAPAEVRDLKMPLVNTGLFERPQAELHQNFRNLDRDSFFRHQNAAKLVNVTTHHSNVFLVRMTLAYFVVDPRTGSVGEEYVTDTGSNLRAKATYIVDRTIPIGFLRGTDVNAMNTVIYSSLEE